MVSTQLSSMVLGLCWKGLHFEGVFFFTNFYVFDNLPWLCMLTTCFYVMPLNIVNIYILVFSNNQAKHAH